jgi:hypothetical protein
MISLPSHVALLVSPVHKAADYFQLGFEVEEEEIFPETREVYVEGGERNSILLMEARDTGSYRRALEKRGPGIHHLAIDVLDLDGYLNSISGSGWLLHLNSLKTIKDYRTAYLARPGFPALIEVQEKNELMGGPLFVDGVSLNFDAGHAGLVKSTGLDQVVKPARGNPFLSIQGKRIESEKLY